MHNSPLVNLTYLPHLIPHPSHHVQRTDDMRLWNVVVLKQHTDNTGGQTDKRTAVDHS